MNGRSLDDNHDIFLKGSGVARNTKWADTVAQRVETMLKTFLGEAYIDKSYGIPWFNEILGGSVLNISYVKTVLKEKIMAVPGVKDVISITLTSKGRVVSGSFSIQCTDNDIAGGAF